MKRRVGSTLVEQVVVMAVVGVCSATIIAGGSRVLDAASVHNAAREVSELFAMARDRAMATGTRTAVQLDVAQNRITVHAREDTLARVELLRDYAVHLETTRDSMAYLPSGLGYGAANLRVIVSRGASRDTINVSRLGRVRR